MPGQGTIDAIFIVRHLQEKYLPGQNKELYVTSVDLEKAFDRVPRGVIWCVMHRIGVEEWLISLVRSMYENARSCVRVNGTYFAVKVDVHQSLVLSPLLFIMGLKLCSAILKLAALGRSCTCMQMILY